MPPYRSVKGQILTSRLPSFQKHNMPSRMPQAIPLNDGPNSIVYQSNSQLYLNVHPQKFQLLGQEWHVDWTISFLQQKPPRQDPNSQYSGVIARFITALLQGNSPVVYGDGEQTRDFTYIDNVVMAVLAACTAPRASGEVINVATGDRVSLNQLFQKLCAIINVEIEPIYESSRPGDVRDSLADCTKAKELLGYQPSVNFEDGLRLTVEWYRQSSSA